MREDHNSFEQRAGLPSVIGRSELEKIGARYLSTEPFDLDGVTTVYEQMQLANNKGMYVWKRIAPLGGTNKPFEIHLEMPHGQVPQYYKTSEQLMRERSIA